MPIPSPPPTPRASVPSSVFPRMFAWAIAWRTLACWVVLLGPLSADSISAAQPSTPRMVVGEPCPQDSIWLLSTRHLTSQACRANLNAPSFRLYQRDGWGPFTPATLETFFNEETPTALDLIYIHGNRMPADELIPRAMFVYRNIIRFRPAGGPAIRFVIWSWPSERVGLALRDVRVKAARTDAQGLYLAWLLREQTERNRLQRLVGFSFGGRVATGSLHALAGGRLGGRSLPGEHLIGAGIGVGLLAPAIGEDWLMAGHEHGRATQNLSHVTLLYNERDAVLKRYPLLDPASGVEALGFRGPRNFGSRYDGSRVPIFKMNCSDTVGLQHNEEVYYTGRCQAGCRIYQMSMAGEP